MTYGEYETVRPLGKGGMSEVWEAVDRRLGSHHAVKVFTYDGDGADVRARFEQEGRMLARLRHPRIVGVRDVGRTDDGRPYFAMDLVLGPEGVPETLADALAKGVDEETVARWYDDIRDALAYIHGKGVVHRDLKLENVMVGPDGHAVLTDFGIARVSGAKDGAAVVDPVKTIVSVRNGATPLMGSLGYMAPELEMGCAATVQSDWYALGVIVYRLLTGTWCDARTDVVGTLETFDPAWTKIIPKLLHANPAGRACLSYAQTHAEAMATAAVAAEERLDRECARGRRLRYAVRGLTVAAVLLAIACGWEGGAFLRARRNWRARLCQMAPAARGMSFDELFAIPPEAGAEETTDDEGDVVMPSREQFSAARIDALVLTQPTFAALENGSLTPEAACGRFESFAEALSEESDHSPLDGLEFGGQAYMQLGDNATLRKLFELATERLRARNEAE